LPAPTLDLSGQIILVIAMQIVFAAASVGGMEAYRIMREVIEEHRAALRALAQRDAQLAEAHEAVRQARGPSEGRYTGEQVGRFQLGQVLGRGAMGEIYAGIDERGQACALKVLAQHLLGNDDALRRFQREAQVISGLDVENIVRVLEVAPPTAAVPYIAMERLEGKDLSALIKDEPVRELDEVVTIMQGLAAGLDVAHEHGVVHRDLKPSNVYAASVGGRVVWKLLDFGVSKLHGSEATLTAAHVVGTPGYMAPEQAAGGEVDLRADVYALGVLAYRLLTGRPAVVPGNPQAMFNEVMNRMPPRPSGIIVMSAEIEAVLAIALAKSRADRFATAGELARAFADAAAGKLPATYVERAATLLRATPWGGWTRVTRGRPTVPTPVTR
jgi:serine/threonine-protein kinase